MIIRDEDSNGETAHRPMSLLLLIFRSPPLRWRKDHDRVRSEQIHCPISVQQPKVTDFYDRTAHNSLLVDHSTSKMLRSVAGIACGAMHYTRPLTISDLHPGSCIKHPLEYKGSRSGARLPVPL